MKKLLALWTLILILAACGSSNPPTQPTPTTGLKHITIDGRSYAYEVRDGLAIYQGDIVMGKAQDLERIGSQSVFHDKEHTCFLFYCWDADHDYRWPGGVVPFVIDSSVTNAGVAATVNQAINIWQDSTPIRFVARSNQSDFVRFTITDDANICGDSPVGRQGGEQTIRFNKGCGFGPVMHEIGHALGLWHEQSRSDRDQNIQINWNNIMDGFADQFDKHADDGLDVGAYDFDSIMHYGSTAFSKNGQATIDTIPAGIPIGQRNHLSAGDTSAIKWLYMRNWIISDGGKSAWRAFGDLGFKTSQMAVGDFNGDGRADLFYADSANCVWYVSYSQLSDPVIKVNATQASPQLVKFPRPNLGTSYAGPWTVLSRGKCESFDKLRFGDFDGDHKTDVFVTDGGHWYISRGGVGWWDYINDSSIPLSQLGFGDFNGDGKTDVFYDNGSGWYVSYGGTGQWQLSGYSSITVPDLGFGDFNGDGKTDLFYGNGSTWYISFNQGGWFGPWTQVNSSSAKSSELKFGDFNNDGITDVYQNNGGNWQISYGATSVWQPLPDQLKLPPYTGVSGFFFADFDGNGSKDVFATVN